MMKNKFYIKLLSLCLCLVLVFSFGCSCNEEEGEFDGGIVVDTTHEVEMTETDKFLVNNGATEYALILPAELNQQLSRAKSEFIYLFNKATGINIKAFTDGGRTHSADAKYISIGETSLFASSGLQIDRNELTKDGYEILTKDNTIYLIGGGDYGSLYAVYGFFELTFGYECYSANCIEIEQDVKNKAFYEYDVKDIPDIEYRNRHYNKYLDAGTTYDWQNIDTRMRLHMEKDDDAIRIYRFIVLNADGTDVLDNPEDIHVPDQSSSGLGHSVLTFFYPGHYLNKDKFPDEYHPKFFAGSDALVASGESFTPKQICLTAHGDAEEYKLMVDIAATKIKMGLRMRPTKDYPYANYVSFSAEDNVDYCTCASCTETVNKYGAISALTILFYNDVIPIVEEWMNKPENAAYKREITYTFYAYDGMEDAPAVYDEESGKYVLTGGLEMNPKIAPNTAIANGLDYQQSLFSEMNKGGLEITKSWTDVSQKYMLYHYSANYNQYLYLYDNFPFINNETFKFYKSVGTSKWYLESIEHDYALTAWNQLKLYLNTKLLWNCELDVDTLIANYFNAMYKDAAPIMRDIFNTTRAYNSKMLQDNKLYKLRSNYMNNNKAQYWELSAINGWLDKFNQAFDTIEKYKAIDKEVYEMLHYNVAQEMVSPMYMKMELYSNDLNYNDYKDGVALLESLVNEVGIKNISQYNRTNDVAMANFITNLKTKR